MHEPRISDLVVESKIEATWNPATEQTTHIRTAVGVSARRRRLKTEETWQRKRILGRGAYGTVWLEERIASSGPSQGDTSLRAIKEIYKRPNVSAYEFHRELEAMAKFSHDRFVHCFVRSLGWFENEESLFITMEYLKYGDLQQYLTKPFPEPEAKQIALQIAEALQLMHESGFAHRDLKPGNVLVLQKGPAWWVKVADFGISKRVEASTRLRTMEIGTRGFMAPEILGLYCPDDFDEDDIDDDEEDDGLSDSLAYTPAIDLWALGEMTHRMLTQKPAFAANKRLWSYVTKGTPFPVNELQSAGTSAQGIKFIQEVMAASPKGRLTAEKAISHEWLESHEFIDETRSRSSIESARELLPSGMTAFDDEPSAQWTITERGPETATEQRAEPLTALPDEELPKEDVEATAAQSRVSSAIPPNEIPAEKEFEVPVANKVNTTQTIVEIDATPVSSSGDQPEGSPTPEPILHMQSPAQLDSTLDINAPTPPNGQSDNLATVQNAPADAPEPPRTTQVAPGLSSISYDQPSGTPASEINFPSTPLAQELENSTVELTASPSENSYSQPATSAAPEIMSPWEAPSIMSPDSTTQATTSPYGTSYHQPAELPPPVTISPWQPPAPTLIDSTTRETRRFSFELPAYSPQQTPPYWEFTAQALANTVDDMTVSSQGHKESGTPLAPVVSGSSHTMDTSPITKHHLKTWWKSIRQPSRAKARDSESHPGIFGVPLAESIRYANVAISLLDQDGNSYIYGYIPIVIAKCGVFLKERGTDVRGIFTQSGSVKRILELQAAFNSPERYGKGLVWDDYTVHDAANIFRRYLNELPEPIVPLVVYVEFCEPLRGATKEAVGDYELPQFVDNFSESEAIRRYQELITQLPPLNRQLLLYILDLLAVFAAKADENGMPANNLASLFQPGILSHPTQLEEIHLNQCVLIFLIENQDHFLIGMEGTASG